MIKLNDNTYLMEQKDIDALVASSYDRFKSDRQNEDTVMYKADVMKDLGIKKERFRLLMRHPSHPPMTGTQKSLQIRRGDFEQWKKEYWGKFKY